MSLRRCWFVFLVCVALVAGAHPAWGMYNQAPKSIATQVCEPMLQEWPLMCLTAVDETPLGNRIPVILIHGWAFENGPDLPEWETWNNFLSYSSGVSWIPEKVKFYQVSYLVNIVSVPDIAKILAELVDDMDALDSNFARQKILLIGYSMGGLVARSFMQEARLQSGRGALGGERVLRLVTLATPHHGAPLANGPSRDDNAGPLLGLIISLVDNTFFPNLPWFSYNRYDFHADSALNELLNFDYNRFPSDANIWLNHLNAQNPYQRKISAYGGSVHTWDSWNSECLALSKLGNADFSDLLNCSALLMNELYVYLWNDGIVPDYSASLQECADCSHETLFGYNHIQMAQGLTPSDSYLFGVILGELSDFVFSNDSRFGNSVIMGNSASEAFHNLRGWSNGGRDSQGTYRNQLNDGLHHDSADLFVPKIGVPYALSFKRADRVCDKDSFYVYLRSGEVDIPLEEPITGIGYQCGASQGYATYRTVLPNYLVKSNRVRIGFLDATSDGSGSKPTYYIRLDPL